MRFGTLNILELFDYFNFVMTIVFVFIAILELPLRSKQCNCVETIIIIKLFNRPLSVEFNHYI